MSAAIYEQRDTDGNGEIRPPEYLRVWGRWARQVTRDPDGPRGGDRNLRSPGQAGPPNTDPSARPGFNGPPAGGIPRNGPPNPAFLLQRFDRNQDGKLSRDEVPEFLWTRMAPTDANQDGLITRQEMENRLICEATVIGLSHVFSPPQ